MKNAYLIEDKQDECRIEQDIKALLSVETEKLENAINSKDNTSNIDGNLSGNYTITSNL